MLANIVSLFSNKLGFLGLIVFPCLVLAVVILKSSVKNIRKELTDAVDELEQEETDVPESQKCELIEGMTQQEYDEMYARIRDEILEELKQSENS